MVSAQSMTDVTNEAQRLREQLEAEREARREAERLAAENARLLYDRQDELELLEMVAAASNEATAIEPALGAAIVHVCAHMRWPVGHAYLVDPATGILRSTGVWYLEDEARFAAFRAASEDPALVPWLPRNVMVTGESAWVTDIDRGLHALPPCRGGAAPPACARASPSRSSSARARSARSSSSPAGPPRPDPALLHIMDQIGVQLGRVVERERARAELERSNADLEAFAYVASHDLAEPLRSVAGFVALLERQYGDRLDDRAREFIAYAVDGVERMQRMIDDLLLYARAGTADLRCERVDARRGRRRRPARPRDRGGRARRGRRGRRAAGGQRRPGPAAARVPQPAGQRDQVHGAGRRAAGVRERTRGRSRRRVAVADNGIGIDPAQVERAFEMFARVPGASGEYQGTGLGLAISRRIVERHGGRLWVEPNPGGGSVFRLGLPLP